MIKNNKAPLRKLTYYHKMKQGYEARIQSLTADIKVLVEEKDFEKVNTLKTRWMIRFSIFDCAWHGTPFIDFCRKKHEPIQNSNGLINFIKKNHGK